MRHRFSVLAAVIVTVAAVAIGFALMWLLKLKQSSSPGSGGSFVEESSSMPSRSDEPADSAPLVTSSSVPVITNNPMPMLSGNAYSLTVQAEVETGDPLQYEVSSMAGQRYTSSTGKFTGLESSKDQGGVYTVTVTNSRTDESAYKVVSGFDPVAQPKVTKLTASELTDIFNSGNKPSDMASKFAKGYKINCVGLDSGEVAPDRYDEIFNRLVAAWSSVSVTDVAYNALDQITSMTINVSY